MNASLFRKEWAQARINVLVVLSAMYAIWIPTFGKTELFLPENGDDEQFFLPLLAAFAGLQLAIAQLGSESLWKTRDLLVFRASGPAAAFRAKCLVGAIATTLFAVGPVLVLSIWLRWTSPWAHEGYWGRAVDYALLGTLGWAAWGIGAFCCQLRHGWGLRVVVALLAGAGLCGAGAMLSTHLASAPPWADLLFPLACAGVGVFFARCAGRAFTAGVDDDVALRDGPGLTVAAGVVLAAGFPLVLVGSALSRFAADELRASFRHVVETPEGGFSPAVRDGRWVFDSSGEPEDYVLIYDPPGVSVFDPDWVHWGWPEPDERLAIVRHKEPFLLGGHWYHVAGWRSGQVSNEPSQTEALYESRARRVHVFVRHPERPRHWVLDPGCSANTLIVWSLARSGSVLADLEGKTLTLVKVEGEDVTLEPLALPGGDQFRGVERLVTRAWAEVGYRAPFDYENGLLIRGERGLYHLNELALEPYVPGPDDQSVAASVADGLVRLRSRYARYDALDPTIEILDASGEQSPFTARLAPPGWRTESLKALALVATLGHTPIASIASFAKREPWRTRSMFDNPAFLGGRRPWLLAACLALAAWLAWRVRRETRAWGRSPLLGAFWVGAILLLGLVGWVLFRIAEPRPARAERVEAPRRGRSGVRAELVAAASGPRSSRAR